MAWNAEITGSHLLNFTIDPKDIHEDTMLIGKFKGIVDNKYYRFDWVLPAAPKLMHFGSSRRTRGWRCSSSSTHRPEVIGQDPPGSI